MNDRKALLKVTYEVRI